MYEIYREMVEIISRGESGVTATIVSSKGSSPRKEGAKMLIRANGSSMGTIGGGGIEKQVMEKASEVLKTGIPVTLHFDMSGSGREAAMVCGGQVDVFMEPFGSPETLYMFGAGHISQYTASIAKKLGFRTVIIDPRPEFNNVQYFPDADKLIVRDFKESFSELKITGKDYILIYTPGHLSDEVCLASAVRTGAKYIGMVGSKKKALDVKKRVVEDGASQKRVNEVHSPVGIDIGSETPAEIAISILAEIIQVKRQSAA